jgi:hypothetical protein
MWLGQEGEYSTEGMPHVTKIKRKPEGVGAEMKAVADGESGCILGVDMMEGKKRMAQVPYAADHQAGTATVLRLCQPWSESGRTVIVDSAFSSVRTLIAVRNILGLFFMGAVKTAHTMFPKAFFDEWAAQDHERGSWMTLTASHKDPDPTSTQTFPMYALAWNDKKVKSIIINCGTTGRCPSDSVRARHRRIEIENTFQTERYAISVKRPSAIEMFFRYFSAIDIHDHYRQGILAIERSWKTHKWWKRVFGTLLGVAVTNSFFMYRLEFKFFNGGSDIGMLTFLEFCDRLTQELIQYAEPDTLRRLRSTQAPIEDEDEEEFKGINKILVLTVLGKFLFFNV